MDQSLLEAKLADLPLGGIQYYPSVGSTNDLAIQWAAKGAEDFSLVIADTQTKGRGRSGRRWVTNPGAGLALSLIFKPGNKAEDKVPSLIAHHTGLGALAVCQVLQKQYSLNTKIKWPNDVLINHRKCCGVLVEAQWQGDQLTSLILGIGVNLTEDALPLENAPSSENTISSTYSSQIAATSLALELSTSVDRLFFLKQLLVEIIQWRSHLGKDSFRKAWERNLAYLNEQICIVKDGLAGDHNNLIAAGEIVGLQKDGALRLKNNEGEVLVVQFGEIVDHQRQNPQRRVGISDQSAGFHLRSIDMDSSS